MGDNSTNSAHNLEVCRRILMNFVEMSDVSSSNKPFGC